MTPIANRLRAAVRGHAARMAAALALAAATVAAPAQTVTYIHSDPLGNPVLATDQNGDVVWKASYRPYGEEVVSPPAGVADHIGFSGHPVDRETGLVYMGGRYYDPVLGRFLGPDPATPEPTNVHSLNRYAYGNNNPYRYVDRDGHTPLDVAFFVWDVAKLGLAMYSGNPAAMAEAGVDVVLSAVGVVSPVPGTGQALKAARAAERGVELARGAERAAGTVHSVERAGEAGREIAKGALPKPQAGLGAVPKSERDPKRYFTGAEREAKRAEQGYQCAHGCGTPIDGTNSAGHHIQRHADGGPSVPANHAEVCVGCHAAIHQRGVSE